MVMETFVSVGMTSVEDLMTLHACHVIWIYSVFFFFFLKRKINPDSQDKN